MKRSIFSGMRLVLATVATAALATISLTGCMSSSETTEPDAAAAAEAPAEGSENAAPANDASNVSGVEGQAASAETPAPANAAGGELQNLVNEGTANAAATPAAEGEATASNAGNDPFAAALNNAATPAPDAAAPVAADAAPATPEAAAPVNAAADPFAPAAGAEATAAVPADAVPAAAPSDAASALGSSLAGGQGAAGPDATIPPAPAEAGGTTTASAPGLPEGGALPEMGTKMPYYIKKGDTLAKIAALVYGNAGKWKSLAEENNLKDPSLIYAGDVLMYTLSEKSQSFAQKYEAAPRGSVTVSRGDTLSSLAQKVFGSQGEWRTLWKMNPQVKNPDVLKVGLVLSYRETAKVADYDSEEGDELVAVAE